MTISYWQQRGPAGNGGVRRKGLNENKYDIAVIGGGITGVATAYFLKKMGCAKVAVLEREYVGYGATGRNAGFILAGLAEPYSRLVVGMGRNSAGEIMRSTMENHDLIEEAVNEKSIDCGHRRCGSYHLAVSELEREELEDSAEMMISHGFNVQYRPTFDGVEGECLREFRGGFFNPGDGRIDPFAFVRGLAADLDVAEGFEVTSIVKKHGAAVIKGKGAEIEAEMVMLAVNAYAPLLDPYFEKLIFPVRGQMLATSPLAGRPLNDFTYYANFGYDYFRQTDDNSLIMGGLRNRFFKDETGYDDVTSDNLQKALEEYIGGKLGVKDFSVKARWGGVMGNTVDGLPLAGSLPSNSSVVALVGCNGPGMGLGMVSARDLAAAIMTGETSDLLRRFSLKRFAC